MENIKEIIFKPVRNELKSYETVINSYMTTDNPILNKILADMSAHRGKGMRPLITILSAKLFGVVSDCTYHLAAGFELFHNATLIHDDIIDESDLRRGRPSVYSLLGSKIAVLVGDYVLTTALISSVETNRIDLMQEVFKAARWLVDGELFQLYNITLKEISEANYYDIIKKKTAILFSSCAKSGAMTTTTNEHDIENMANFGMLVGKCFQIKDDIFDYIAGEEIGKPRGNDMIEGKLTLPVIHALLTTNNPEMMEIARKVKGGEASRVEVDQLTAFAIENNGIEYSYSVMGKLADQARAILSEYPDGDVKNAMLAYIDYVISREK